MRRLRILYAAGITAVVLAALVIVKIAYVHGEISHVSLHTVTDPPAAVALTSPASTLGKTWSSTDATALGVPYSAGTVVTHDEHTVRGRDARTGAQTWTYTRTDRSVCTAMQADSRDGPITVAVYSLHGDCDEVTALDSRTGARKWTRTLFEDTALFRGPATFAVTPGTLGTNGQSAYFYFVSSTSIYMIDSTGYLGWTFHHVGCTIGSAVVGTSGVLVSQTCKGEDCNGTKLCGNGVQLLLRDATASRNEDDKTNNNNPDQVTWNDFGSALVPTSAGRTVTARDSDGSSLHLFDDKGKQAGQIALDGAPGRSAQAVTTTFADGDLIWLDGRTYALDDNSTSVRWTAQTRGAPVPTEVTDAGAATLGASTVAVATTDGVAFLAAGTGKQTSGYPTGEPAVGTLPYRLGAGFVLSGAGTTVLS